MPTQPTLMAQVRAGVYELVLDVARMSVTEQDLNARCRRVCAELTELCGLSACVIMLVDSTGSVRALIGSRPEAEQLTRLVHQLGIDAPPRWRGQRFAPAEDLTKARTVVAEAAGKVGLPVTAAIGLYGMHEPVGYLRLFGAELSGLTEELLRELLPLADVLGTALHDAGAYQHSTELVVQLSEALEAQRPVEQAKGLLAQRHQVDLDTAYRILRDQARRRDTSVTRVASEVISQYWHPSFRPSVGTSPDGASPAADTAETGKAPLPEQRGVPTESGEINHRPAG